MARAIVTYGRGWHALALTRSLGRQGIEVFCGDETRMAPCSVSKYCRLEPIWVSVKHAGNPKDIKAWLKEMFDKHRDTINGVMIADDPKPGLGVLFPLALMLKQGKISMAALTGEEEIANDKPRRRFHDMLARPTWKALMCCRRHPTRKTRCA